MSFKARKWGGLLLLLALGCEETPNINEFNYKPEVNLFALLILNPEQTIVRVERSYRALEKVPADRGITDAEVVISSPEQQVSLTHQEEGRYVTPPEQPLKLSAGTTYQISVRLADGRLVTAECTMPFPPQITTPGDHERVAAYSSLPVAWESQVEAPRYLISVRGNMNGYKAEAAADSLAMTFYPFYLAEPDIYVLKVAAMDRNYYDYSRMADDEEPVWHIQGGIGVFGAIAFDQRIIIAE